jgi:hypothetical protein
MDVNEYNSRTEPAVVLTPGSPPFLDVRLWNFGGAALKAAARQADIFNIRSLLL